MKLNYHDGDTVEMLFDSKLHSYKVGDEIIPSATKVLDIISKPALVPWALKVGANWLEKNFFFDEDSSSKKTKVYKSRMAIEPLIKGMKSAYRSKSHDAINIGNITHNWVEEAINWKLEGGEIPKMPDAYAKPFSSGEYHPHEPHGEHGGDHAGHGKAEGGH